MNDNRQRNAALVLFLLFFVGLAFTLGALIDLQWTHRVLVHDAFTSTRAKQELR